MKIKNLAIGSAVIVAMSASTAFASSGHVRQQVDDDLAHLDTDRGPPAAPASPLLSAEDGAFAAPFGDATITLPLQANGTVTVGDTGLTIGLPGESDQQGQLASDGSLVYADPNSFATVIQNEADGVQIHTVLHDSASPTEFSYPLSGGTALLREDGGIDIVDAGDGQSQQILAAVDAPWATDAAGNDVPTHYELNGDSIVQVVAPTPTTVFPVVADPKVSYGTGVYFSFTKAEMHAMVLGAQTIIAVGGNATCAVYGKKVASIPGVNAVVGYVCGYASPKALYGLFKSMNGKIAASYPNACYQYRVPATNPAWKSVDKSQCGLK